MRRRLESLCWCLDRQSYMYWHACDQRVLQDFSRRNCDRVLLALVVVVSTAGLLWYASAAL